ncbi:filamentous hemagglutinin N-terminal domain-containing protein [Oscillatoria acuminata]|uniref:Filamentous hemagglutinin family N-terminal domain protein n=1 Tax=Oscillatoria acuminata PCC 6304 TaxID=56110 RepID=K9TIP7_9CYAN|nr:filamentous hemagglutinin N-terminal domain-containing protein [Oscillatoria acuminata]AFY82420.1 filamentous hemagglutinin family N-terminal domain protein [Oscillatoria acuminata PCC 6304]
MGHRQRSQISGSSLTGKLAILSIALCLFPPIAVAQIVPDATLPVNSIVTPDGDALIIEGGTSSGFNLFHSFQEFSIPTDTAAFFNNDPTIANIFTRITGISVSNIDGVLATTGTANLFLLNPNGIVFGPNAQLSIGGSFLATTADRFTFADRTQFGADVQTPPQLTISTPIGLQYGSNPGDIAVGGAELQISPGETLTLAGGNVFLEGAALLAESGRIELSSAIAGELSLIPLQQPSETASTVTYGDIQLSQGSAIDTSGEAGGDIQLQGRRIELRDGSLLQTTTLGEAPGGNLTIRAAESLKLSGNDLAGFPSGLLAETAGAGDGGNIGIVARRVVFQDGGQASASALAGSTGNGGNVRVNALEFIEISGSTGAIADPMTGEEFGLKSGLFTEAQGAGNGGNIEINSPRITLRDGAQVSAVTIGAGNGGNIAIAATTVELVGISGILVNADIGSSGDGGDIAIATNQAIVRDGAQIASTTFGEGDAGDIRLNASELLQVSGTTADFFGGIFAEVAQESTGNGGNITLESDRLLVDNGASISTSTTGQGQGGILTIYSQSLTVRGGQIAAATVGEFPGGSISIVSDSVELSGTTPDGFPSGIFTQTLGSGNAGDLTISSSQLTIRDGAKLSVSGEATGNAGSLTVNSDALELQNAAILTGETVSGQGGNIGINADTIILRGNSNISTTAGTQDNPGNGGNITIDTEAIAGLENSNISANAFNGSGGAIAIATDVILGLEAKTREQLESELGEDLTQFDPNTLSTNDITAISRTDPSLSGTIGINTPDVDPSKGFVELPDETVDVARLINDTVCRLGQGSEFVQTGRGGLPPSPTDPLTTNEVWEDWRLPGISEEGQTQENNINRSLPQGDRMIEARDWQMKENGDLALIAPPLASEVAIGEAIATGCVPLQAKMRSPSGDILAIAAFPDKPSSQTVQVQQFEAIGSTVFTPEQLAAVTQPFLQDPLTFDRLLNARSAIAQLYLDAGYLTSGAYIPPQIVQNGVVTIQVVEGQLENIAVRTNGRLNESYIQQRLERIISEPVHPERVLTALQLLQLDENIETISAELSPGVRPGTNLLTVTVKEKPLLGTQLSVDNNRAPSVGSFRQTVQTNFSNLLGLGDVATVAYTHTDGSNTWDVVYGVPVNARNGMLSFYYGRGDSKIVEAPFDELEIEADSQVYEIAYRQPFQSIQKKARENGEDEYVFQEFALGLTASRRNSQTSLLGVDFPLSPGANDAGETRISALRFFQEWTQRQDRQVFAARSQLSLGVGWFDATVNESEPDSRFLAWRGQAQWVRRVTDNTLLLMRGDLQLSPNALLPFEQFGLGGQDRIRGYRQDALLTDNGALASVELRLPIPVVSQRGRLVQIAPFLDAGVGWNSDDRPNPEQNALLSAGVGLRMQFGNRLTARVDWGIPLVNLDSRAKTWQENGIYFTIVSDLFSN